MTATAGRDPRLHGVTTTYWSSGLMLALVAIGCGSEHPTTPTLTPVAAPLVVPVVTYTISGQVTATNGQQALGGARVTIDAGSVTADGSGRYSLTQPVSSAETLQLTIAGAGLVTRQSSLDASSRAVNLDAIASSGGFDLNFYRQFVRGTFDAPATLEPLRRWTRAPVVYLKTVDDTGAPIDAAQLDVASTVLQEAAFQWSAGRFGIAGIERGIGTKEGISGYLTVKWINTPDNICGRAQVGQDGGFIELEYRPVTQPPSSCSCGDLRVRPLTVRHELGHAFGFRHTDSTDDVMSGIAVARCDQPLSGRERYHAAIAYSRPVGNVDPDTDPSGQVTLRTLSVP